MADVFTLLDVVIFFVALVGVTVIGLIAGRTEATSEDYFLAGRGLPWWAVAGSIFGTNVSASHIVGMLGIGYSVGFAQSHFELGAVFGLLLLCYGFLPVYRKLGVFTLSEYLGRRYDERSRVAYAAIMLVIMVLVQIVPGLYIGARSACFLLGGDALVAVSASEAEPTDAPAAADADRAVGVPDRDSDAPRTRYLVRPGYYAGFVIALAVLSASYTFFGGLKADVWTDVAQSVLLLFAGILVAVLTFRRIGGWGALMVMDRALDQAAGAGKMHLYLPSNHPALPWTGVFSGLIAMHCFYWGTNQFIVQRALGARSDADAQNGVPRPDSSSS